ncbi:uncharacterized protein LOC125220303 [Salvia hispanica]|uniref:uncharacterized protein LOC125220303 n=1 Tax=Salvia hispanica TaxID=49212 RepID=UPI002009467D|nr:uncharacterized protein LOC125220303 [Salvia hispanica]
MSFVDGLQARDAITDNAVENDWQIHFKRANKKQFEAACHDPCAWFCSGSLVSKNGVVVIKKSDDVHTCPRAVRNKLVTSTWIASKYLHVFRLHPSMSCKDLGRDLMQRYAFDATKCRLYHAKRKAIDMLVDTVEEHYAKLSSYTLEFCRSDREGRFELHVDVGAVFNAMYIGFSGLKKGFMEGCRRVIGLDGAFPKTYLGGILLSAVGTDGNNQMYPIAWVVVEVEMSFVGGLENAVKEIISMAEHINCARNIYANWKKTHKGPALKQLFWKLLRSTYMQEYVGACRELEKEDG